MGYSPINIIAAILAGGLGTRLRSVVADRPKVLAQVGDEPFLSKVLDVVEMSGIRRVVLCVGYMADEIQKYYGKHYGNLELVYSVESRQRGTAGALGLARELLMSDPVLVLNGDSLCRVDIGQFLCDFNQCKPAASIAVVRVRDTSRFGSVECSTDGRVRAFKEKQKTSGEGLVNAGIYLLSKELIRTIPDDREYSLEKDVFPSLCDGRLHAYVTQNAELVDIGTPESYAAAVASLPLARKQTDGASKR